MSDRVERRRLQVKTACLARALGATRQDLALVLRTLRNLLAIDCDADTITIHDRLALEQLSCDCYQLTKPRSPWLAGVAEALPLVALPLSKPALAIVPPPAAAEDEEVCERCGVAAAFPHATERECLIAIDAEMTRLHARTSTLQQTRTLLVKRRSKSVFGLLHALPLDGISKNTTRR